MVVRSKGDKYCEVILKESIILVGKLANSGSTL